MEKDQILESVQKNKPRNEYEDKIDLRATTLGFATSLFAAFLLYYLEYIISERVNLSLIAVGFAAGAAQDIYKGIKTKHTATLIFGIVYALISLSAAIIAVWKMVNN